MSNVVKYKNYWATVEYDADDQVLHGKIEGIQDLVNFECENASEAQAEFEAAVDDYLAFCHDVGKQPEKPFSGSFNIRVSPELHRACSRKAAELGTTLNTFVQSALNDQLNKPAQMTFVIESGSLASMNGSLQLSGWESREAEAEVSRSSGILAQKFATSVEKIWS